MAYHCTWGSAKSRNNANMSVQKTKSPCIPSALFQQNPDLGSYGKYSDPSSLSPGTFSWFPSGFTATFSATALIDASYVKSFEELRARDLRLDIEPLLPPCHMSWWCESNALKPVVGRIPHCRHLPQPKTAVESKLVTWGARYTRSKSMTKSPL